MMGLAKNRLALLLLFFSALPLSSSPLSTISPHTSTK
jgi:hypothetical protein